ncbi:MAG: sigma-70 family RNA polymerase sigma factor [Acidobacteria bacterium]|nr:sigma-70 family RNA polymerase sigma factor [Acidobacteriota bacterium]
MVGRPTRMGIETPVPRHGESALTVESELLEAVRRLRAGVEVETSARVVDAQLRPRLLCFFRTHSFSREDAEDLVQKTLARVYAGVQQLAQAERFFGWLFAIARNVQRAAAAERQRASQLVSGGIEPPEEFPDPVSAKLSDDQQLDENRLAAVRAAIEQLPVQQRQCLLLRVREELSYEEIAESLRLSVNTVRNHLAGAKRNLRRVLQGQGMKGMKGRETEK